jgi:hypothetical protein
MERWKWKLGRSGGGRGKNLEFKKKIQFGIVRGQEKWRGRIECWERGREEEKGREGREEEREGKKPGIQNKDSTWDSIHQVPRTGMLPQNTSILHFYVH